MTDPGSTMNEETVGRELAAEFYRILEDEPPFATDLGQALRAAEREGRRRRGRTLAVRGGVTALAIAASTALVIAWPGQDRPLNTPAVVVPTEVTTTARPVDPIARLEQLVDAIARPSGGVVRVQRRNAALAEIAASARTRDGVFEVAADVSSDNSDLRTAQEMCQSDGFNCTELLSTPTLGVWAREDPARPGRETLELTAEAPDGKWLWAQIDNYVETGGSQTFGPTWKDAGITAAGLRQAAAASGLTTDPGS
jgi:hypothetical protein